MGKRARMVGWYDPPRLAAIAVRVAISSVFGEFADRREAMAAAREVDPQALDPAYDYRGGGNPDFWFDFIADCGDGWNPTYAIARLLAQSPLTLEDGTGPLPRGSVLIMGGDQVYPTASRDDYQVRVVEPFDEAAKGVSWQPTPDLYAIPGNHDWYDGLSAFLGLFCRRRNHDGLTPRRPGRKIGERQTQQTRSYFALRLPHGWWLWGADIQLEGYIDQPQIDFFTHVAQEWMEPGSRLVLCTGQPSWAYVDPHDPETVFKNFSYLASIVTLAGKGHRLRLVLSGDSHHYARYVEGECQYITAGGGGAFLHPTHQLTDKEFDWPYPPPGTPGGIRSEGYPRKLELARDAAGQPATFPDQAASRALTWRNLAFAWLNWRYASTLGAACGIFAWLLHAEAWRHGSSLVQALAAPKSFIDAVCSYLGLVVVSPWPVALVAVAFVGYYAMCGFPSRWRLVAGGLHGLAQTISVMLLSCLIARLMPAAANDWWLILAIAIAGGALSATLHGLYLLISLNVFGVHWNEAFSSLRIEDYKNFLRLHIAPDGALTIYPVGLKHVPAEPRTGPLTNPSLSPRLIEKPIILR